MAIQSVKSILTGVVATVIGGIVLLWLIGIIPIEQTTSPLNESSLDQSKPFSFYSPVIKVFEGSGTIIEQSDRVYQDTFSASQLTYIYWELVVNHAELKEDVPVTILSVYRNDKGEELTRMNYESTSRKGWKASMYTWGWGSAQPGYWKSGEHVIELYYSGNLIGSKKFHIL